MMSAKISILGLLVTGSLLAADAMAAYTVRDIRGRYVDVGRGELIASYVNLTRKDPVTSSLVRYFTDGEIDPASLPRFLAVRVHALGGFATEVYAQEFLSAFSGMERQEGFNIRSMRYQGRDLVVKIDNPVYYFEKSPHRVVSNRDYRDSGVCRALIPTGRPELDRYLEEYPKLSNSFRAVSIPRSGEVLRERDVIRPGEFQPQWKVFVSVDCVIDER